jgi:hypothetical protein
MATNGRNGKSGNRVTLSVRSLINSDLTKPQRAFIGKKVKFGEIELELTNKLIAQAVGCSVGYLRAAVKCSEGAEDLIKEGLRPLILRPIQTTVNGKPALVIPAETDDQLVEIAHRVGVERMWDAIQRAMT